MATIVQNRDYTISGIMAAFHEGKLLPMANVLEESNAIIQDIVWGEADEFFKQRTVTVTALPTVRRRRINQSVATSVGAWETADHVLEMLEQFSRIDEKLLRSKSDQGAFRMQQATLYIEAMAQQFADDLIYGNNTTNPEQMTGLAPRMGTINSKFVLSAGGSGADLTSLYAIQWGRGMIWCAYPKGGKGMISHEDRGRQLENTADGTYRDVYVDKFTMEGGLVVENPRCMARLANIETTGQTNLFDYEKIIDFKVSMPKEGQGAILYANRTLYAQIKKAALAKTNAYYTYDNVFGTGMMPVVDGSPVRLVDSILDTENAIS